MNKLVYAALYFINFEIIVYDYSYVRNKYIIWFLLLLCLVPKGVGVQGVLVGWSGWDLWDSLPSCVFAVSFSAVILN